PVAEDYQRCRRRRIERLPAPAAGVPASTRIAWRYPYGARERPSSPIARPPCPARSHRIIVAPDPSIIRGWIDGIDRCRRIRYHGRRRVGHHRRRYHWVTEAESKGKVRPGKCSSSSEQGKNEQFRFHFVLRSPHRVTLHAPRRQVIG